MSGFYVVHSLSLAGVNNTLRRKGTVMEHGQTAELPTVATAAAQQAESALLHAKPSIRAGALGHPVIHLFFTQVLASAFPEGLSTLQY